MLSLHAFQIQNRVGGNRVKIELKKITRKKRSKNLKDKILDLNPDFDNLEFIYLSYSYLHIHIYKNTHRGIYLFNTKF